MNKLDLFVAYLHKKLFPKQQKLVDHLLHDNIELHSIASEQVEYIKELQDKIHRLEYREEDLELEIERLKDKVDGLEYDLENTENEFGAYKDRVENGGF